MDSEECEDWLLESIKLYQDLHDFELQEATRVIQWTGEKSICIAGYTRPQRNEILQLLFPQRLHETENQSLCPERDLKVEYGGFSEEPIYSLRHIPGTSLLVSSSPSSAHVHIWQIGAEDKDVIQPVKSIQSDPSKETWTKVAVWGGAAARVVHGGRVDAVHVTEVESAKRLHTLAVPGDEAIGSISPLDPSTFHLCCLSGRQIVADVRRPGTAHEGTAALTAPSAGRWCAAVKPGNQDPGTDIASLSSEGHMTITDTRDMRNPLKCAKSKSSRSPAPEEHMMCVCWAPRLQGCVSISGLDGTVQIYDTQRWDTAMEEAEALFTHRGHSAMGGCEDGSAPLVTVHSWHPWKERTLVSAANDGSLHIWDWLAAQH